MSQSDKSSINAETTQNSVVQRVTLHNPSPTASFEGKCLNDVKRQINVDGKEINDEKDEDEDEDEGNQQFPCCVYALFFSLIISLFLLPLIWRHLPFTKVHVQLFNDGKAVERVLSKKYNCYFWIDKTSARIMSKLPDFLQKFMTQPGDELIKETIDLCNSKQPPSVPEEPSSRNTKLGRFADDIENRIHEKEEENFQKEKKNYEKLKLANQNWERNKEEACHILHEMYKDSQAFSDFQKKQLSSVDPPFKNVKIF